MPHSWIIFVIVGLCCASTDKGTGITNPCFTELDNCPENSVNISGMDPEALTKAYNSNSFSTGVGLRKLTDKFAVTENMLWITVE